MKRHIRLTKKRRDWTDKSDLGLTSSSSTGSSQPVCACNINNLFVYTRPHRQLEVYEKISVSVMRCVRAEALKALGALVVLSALAKATPAAVHGHTHSHSHPQGQPEREHDGHAARDADHYRDGNHYSEFDHEAILGNLFLE